MSIPKVAHVIWLGTPMRASLRGLLRGFEMLHPEWRVRWWDEAAIDAFGLTNRDAYERAGEYVPADSMYQLRSDVARYEILYREGGVYLDPDFRWQHRLDAYLDRDFLIPWEVTGSYVANGIIGSVPGHPILAATITELRDRLPDSTGRDWRANRVTGTHVLTPIVLRHGVRPLARELFCPAPWNRPELTDDLDAFPDAVAVHMWNHQREIRGLYED